MMESPCTQQYFLSQRNSCLLLTLVLTVTGHFSVTGATRIMTKGEVGGNLTIDCPFDKERPIKFFYFQKGHDYINGFHTLKNLSMVETWKNTRVDPPKTTVHIFNLGISHGGDYTCHIQYTDTDMVDNTDVHISVTANYNIPKVMVQCTSDLSCLVKCDSHGGYPRSKITWNFDSETEHDIKTSEMQDPDTMTFNISSTAYFNCSKGELKFSSCSVGNVTSRIFSVCTPEEPDTSNHTAVIATACAAVLLIFIMSIVFVRIVLKRRRCKREVTGELVEDVSQERIANGHEWETIKLNEKNEDEEAS